MTIQQLHQHAGTKFNTVCEGGVPHRWYCPTLKLLHSRPASVEILMLITPGVLGLSVAIRMTYNAIQLDLVSVPVMKEWRLSLCWILYYMAHPKLLREAAVLLTHSTPLLVSHMMSRIFET